ncbi:MAG: hypothetical protein HeimC2_06090 [Candidatus Heimdallarchaeota archaeon LC_2]|nr:MAG: hypothetical protein HeimC2_06090 [Candidatus Heimdallarchaeota archaeon LC_2]
MLKSRKGTTNVIATMLIFIIMIASMGVLYSRISPTIFGFEATTQANNQEFVMYSIANAVTDLVSSAEDAQNRAKIISKGAIYSINSGYLLDFNITGTPGPILFNSQIGSFTGNVTAEFQGRSGISYFGRNTQENSFVNWNTTTSDNFVSKVEYVNDEARFSLYFRSRIEISEQLPNGQYDITIIVIKLEFNPDFVDFPIDLDEWTLRLRRRASNITEFPSQLITGDLTILHSINGIAKPDGTYLTSSLSGEIVNIKFIEVPILLTI